MKCSACQKPVHGKCLKDGKKYFHFSCVSCHLCKQPMKGYVKFKNHKFFHGDCFRCVDCNEECFHDSSVLKAAGLKCNKCGRTCLICNEKNPDMTLSMVNSSVHTECYKCSNCGLIGNELSSSERLIYGIKGFQHEICSKKKCVVCFETLGTNYAITMGFPVHLNGGCKNYNLCSCRQAIIPIHQLWSHQWTVKTHPFFSKEVREAVSQIFLIWKFRNSVFSMLPRDMINLLCQKIATLDGWEVINGFSVYDFCFPNRCTKKIACDLCTDVFPLLKDENKCSFDKCIYYKFRCLGCKQSIPHFSPGETCCTPTRCIINDYCYLCNGELVFGEEDARELCGPHCKTYSRRCKCGQLIRINPISPEAECTVYRCLEERCRDCGNNLQPFNIFSKGCTKISCLSTFQEIKNLEKYLNKQLNIPKDLTVTNDKQMLQQYRTAFSTLLLTGNKEDMILISSVLSRWESIVIE